jgi:hypothetical protein
LRPLAPTIGRQNTFTFASPLKTHEYIRGHKSDLSLLQGLAPTWCHEAAGIDDKMINRQRPGMVHQTFCTDQHW